MIIIRLRSGLGNQMFQYAFFKQMQFWHGEENVKLDIDTYGWHNHNGREIDKIFTLDFYGDTATKKQSLHLADVSYSLPSRILRKIRGAKHKKYLFWKEMQLEDYKNLSGDIYLEGFWNEEKYFYDVQSEIRKIYTFPDLKNNYQLEILDKIQTTESVGIHIRRGDYVKYPDKFPMCTPNYYKKALEIIKQKYKDVSIFIFSDDLNWCKSELSFINNVTFVENKVNTEAFVDMLLMSRCKHNIIANSTFSWWGAWLNNNPDKVVIYPETALITYETLPNHWIKI